MTPSEAITKLQSLRNLRGAREAIDLAIQALGKQPWQPEGPRYCPMCDVFMQASTCKACGQPTEKVPHE